MSTYLQTMGGAGTYAIHDFLKKVKGKVITKGVEGKNNPHSRNPKYQEYWNHKYNGKVVYLYSNPYDTILSFYRRGFFNNINHYKNLECNNLNKIKLGLSLEEFLKNGEDYFQLEEHFKNWYNYKDRYYDIMFIKYEKLEKNIISFMSWFDISEKDALKFKVKKRNSDWRNENDNIKKGLKHIYGDFKQFLDELDDKIIFKK